MKYDDDNALTKLHESLTIIEDRNRLDEGAWEKIKYGLGKYLPKYKVGGKNPLQIKGRMKARAKAEAQLEAILEDESNKVIKELLKSIKKAYPKFPNNEKRIGFLKSIISVSQLHDSIVEATKKKPNEKGYMPVDAANKLIRNLRKVVKNWLDVDLETVYTTMESEDGRDNILTEEDELILSGDILTEEEIDLLYEKNFLSRGWDKVKGAGSKVMDKAFGAKSGKDEPQKKGSSTSAKQQKTSGNKDFETARMGKKGLESNRLPIILTALGGAMGTVSWVLQTDWFKDIVSETMDTPAEWGTDTVKTAIENNINVDPNGLTYTIQNNLPPDMGINLGPDQPIANMHEALKFYGDGNEKAGLDVISEFIDPKVRAESVANLTQQLSDGSANQTIGDIFNTGEGTYGTRGGLFSQYGGAKSAIAKMVITRARRVLIKQAGKTVATTALGGKLISLAPILGYLAIPLVAAGITVKILREKGQRQSRAKTLNDLLQSLQDVKPTKENPPVIDSPKPDPTVEPDPDVEPGVEPGVVPPTPDIPTDFLKGNRNMQLIYLSQNFLPGGKSLWSNLGLKEGTILASSFFDAALSQGGGKRNLDSERYLTEFHKHLEKKSSFTKKINVGAWLTKVRSNENQALIKWVRNTRKGIGSFFTKLKKGFPEDFEIGVRQKAKVLRPGERGKAMGLAGESLNGRFDLITELSLGSSASQAGFDETLFMKNLPQFMEMLSMMYYGAKGSKLEYNKEAVLTFCKKYGCKGGSSKKYKQTKDDDYQFVEGVDILREEIKRIKQLMK